MDCTRRIKVFKLSTCKRFFEKLTDIVEVYLNQPDKAVVLQVDEKSRAQVLDRRQPGLPMKKVRWGNITHDYKRNGTTYLLAMFNVPSGTMLGTCSPPH